MNVQVVGLGGDLWYVSIQKDITTKEQAIKIKQTIINNDEIVNRLKNRIRKIENRYNSLKGCGNTDTMKQYLDELKEILGVKKQ